MNSPRRLAIRFLSLFRKGRGDARLEEELRGHIELLADENVRRGMPPDEARAAAHRTLGHSERIREAWREQRGLPWLESFFQDVRYGLRLLRKNPGFAAVAIATLALGIGANTAVFSMIDSVFLDKLPYPHADRLVMVWEDVHLPHYQNSENTPAPGNYEDWKKQNTVFSGMAAIGYRSWNLTGAGEPTRIEGEAFSADIFSVLETYPILGRGFTAQEDQPGASRVALLGYGLWQSRFAGDRNVVGRAIQLDGADYQIIGVMPAGFRFPDPGDELYVPLALSPRQLANHGSHFLRVVARLKPSVTLAQAQSEMTVIAHRLTRQYPDSNMGTGIRVVSFRDQAAAGLGRPLLVLFGVVALLLLMVCANVANLFLARSSLRRREFALRAALGAGRARIVRQLLVEGALIAALAGATGITLAFWGIDGLRAIAPASLNLAAIQPNPRIALFTAAVSLLCGLAFGLAPALQSARREAGPILKEDSRGSAPRAQLRARALLVIAEMALGVTVLAGTGLLLRSFANLENIPLGFQPKNVLTFRAILRGPRYATLAQQNTFYRETLERIRALPGVEGAGGISFLPLTMSGRTAGITIEGRPPSAPGELPFADFRSVSPGYFPAMRIPILQGRDVSWDDTPRTPLVAVVSRRMAGAFWPGADALGKRFKLGGPADPNAWVTVVGVVGNVRQLDLTGEPRPAIYFSATQDPGIGDLLRDWVVRAPNASALAPAIRQIVSSIDPSMPVSRLQSMDQIRSAYLGPQRFELILVGLFGIAGLLLAGVGLYGVTSYSVAQRTHEMGVRMALGASRGDLLRMVLRQALVLALAGVAIGIGGAMALTRFLSSLLFEIAPTDPLTFAAVSFVLCAVAIAASLVPAWRATRVDPTQALRYE